MTSQLSDRTLAIVEEALLTIGYDGRAIVANYDFAVPGNQNALEHVDLAAFSDPVRHDLHTSCIAAQRVSSETNVQPILDKLSYLATPFALILETDAVDIWPVTTIERTEPIARVPYDRLSQFFVEHAGAFRPDILAAAKIKGHQLSFFDLDRTLLQFAYESTQHILVERFENAVSAARHSLRIAGKQVSSDLTKAVLQILAAAVLEDKHLLGDNRSSTVEDLIRRSARRYGQYFDVHSLSRIGYDVAQVTFDALRHNVTFRSFTNEMLGHFYENAFVDQQLRRELGIYYTPQSIAKRILTRLPIEDIPPYDRVIFDGSSGSGNLLLAGYERLSDLLPHGWDRDKKHEYLVQRLHGVDVDQFAAQVAGLSLFFIDLPAGDAWDVRAADFLTPGSTKLPKPPTILVGNPPFKELRSSEGRRLQRASLFLSKYLDLLGSDGLLGMVLPETFLENSSCRDVRRRLLQECEILELWHLPEGIFPMSNVATVIVLAKKLPAMPNSLRGPVRVERVAASSHEKKQFLDGARPRFSYVVPSTQEWAEDPDSRVLSSPLESSVWGAIHVPRRLREVALIRNGIIRGESQQATHFDNYRRGAEWRPWIAGASDLEPYALKPSETRYVRYPGNLHRPRLDLEAVFALPKSKVLINSARAPGNPWRLYAAIDDLGYFPSQNLHCVIPKDRSVTLEELVAVFNSSIASAWVDSRNRKRWIGERTLRDMPFPIFTDPIRESVIARVSEIMVLKQRVFGGSSSQRSDFEAIRHLALSIDELVYDAFEVGEEGRKMLNRLFAGYRRPGIEWSNYSRPMEEVAVTSNARQWSVTGQVIQIDAENNALTLWVRGFHDSQPFRMPIPETMPGWALRPDATFKAEIPWQVRYAEQPLANDLSNFRPLEFSYSDPEELVELLENPKKLDGLYDH